MASRKTKPTEQEKRLIRGTQLLNRLNKHQEGEIILTRDQVRSIELILKYTLPTFKHVEADVNGKLDVQVTKIEEVIVEANSSNT